MTATQYPLGIDISKHQGTVDHFKVAKSGMVFCICKASEGVGYADPKFQDNMEAIREVGSQATYYPGAYHFARPDTGGGAEDGRKEAEWFCDVVEEASPNGIHNRFLPPALDFEKYSESDEKDNIPWISTWIEVVERRLERRPMIYTGRNIWRYEVGNTDKFNHLPLWQVYYSSKAQEPPSMPWPKWTLWQFSGGGKYQNHPKVPGAGVVDVNRFNGSISDLKGWFANDRGAPEPPAPVETQYARLPIPDLDLEEVDASRRNELVARLQWFLMANGADWKGLVGSDGLPDGKGGPNTQAALLRFQSEVMKRSAPRPVVDFATWWALAFSIRG